MTIFNRIPPSPFSAIGADVALMGYKPIPLMPGKKGPGECRMGRWFPMESWPDWRTKSLGKYQVKIWNGWQDAGIGIVLGNEVVKGWEVGCVDFDTDDVMALEIMESALPESPIKKRGRRGHTSFYLFPTDTKGRRFRRGTATICEILTGTGARQTVIPPSLHPDTGQPYIWLTKQTLGTLAPIHLPRVTEEMIERFVDTVEQLGGGDIREAVGTPYQSSETGSPHNLLNTAALNQLDKWVPDLRLDRCKKTSAGYVAVPHWRPSVNGTPDADRKAALGFSAQGIRDFSADMPHSPLDIVMMANGWDLDTAYEWLAPRCGMWEDGFDDMAIPVTLSGPESVTGRPEPHLPPHDPVTGEILDETPEPAPEPEPEPAKIVAAPAPNIVEIPGLVGQVLDWIVATSRQPNRMLALGAAITIVGTLMGRRIAGPTDSGTHLYVIALAPSGAGKDHALRQIGPLLKAANAGHLLGPDDFMSMSAVVALLKRSALSLCAMDEFGAFVGRIGHIRASPHEKGMTKTLRTAWGASFSPMMTPEYAGKPSEEILSPALSIYGNSTPGEFFDALQGADVVNGFLNRFLMLYTDLIARDQEPRLDKFVVPEDLRDAMRRFHLAAMANTPAELAEPMRDDLAPRRMPWGPGAKESFDRMKTEVEAITADKDDHKPFYARTIEMAVRLATIRAAGIDIDGAVSANDFAWGRAVAMLSAGKMVEVAGDHMAGTPFAAHSQRIIRFMKKKGTKVSRRDIHCALKGELKTGDLTEQLKTLIEAGRIIELKRDKPQVGRPPTSPFYQIA